MKKNKSTKYRLEVREFLFMVAGCLPSRTFLGARRSRSTRGRSSATRGKKRAKKGAAAIMELGQDKNIDGFDGGNGAAYANHNRENPNCFVLRQKGKVWLVAGIEGIKAGEELTYDYGSDYYRRKAKRSKKI